MPRQAFHHPLIRMIALGCVIIGLQTMRDSSQPEQRELRIDAQTLSAWKQDWQEQRTRGQSTLEWEQALAAKVDGELLVDEALRLNLHISDLVVRRRLRQNLLFAEIDLEGDDGLSRAYELRMPQNDPLVRRRLRQLMEMRLRSDLGQVSFAEDQLAQYQRAGETRIEKYSFYHVLRGGSDSDGELQKLVQQFPDPEQAIRHSAPFLHGLDFDQITPARIEKLLGSRFAEALAEQPLRRWGGPIRSPYGLHMLWVQDKASQKLTPDLDQAYYALLADEERKSLHRGMAALRGRYQVILDGMDI